ncbi:response regulator [Nisaea sp.]|uniref:response regulator n=1 Tax=Nisaea sp. TaxID=2024842 RepID=UPI00326734A6
MSSNITKPVILFVDDEPNIISGLRRMLRSMRNEWDMEFLVGGQEAVDRINAEPFDAVVTDMRMPSIDGVAVLTAAAEKNPESIRFILSGFAEQEAMLAALGYAHRFIAKPCDADLLIGALRSTFSVRDLLPVKSLRILLGEMKSVPVLSERYTRLLKELDDPLSTTVDIAKTIEEDLGLSTQILRLANSAYFNLSRKLSNCGQAVDVLGIETVRALLMVSEFYVSETADSAETCESKILAERSLMIGGLSRQIALTLNLGEAQVDEAATAGVLCHIGTAILRLNHVEKFTAAMSLVEAGTMSVIEAEREVFGASHAELAAYLMGLWGFPDGVVEAVAFHHEPAKSGKTEVSPLSVVHLAQAFVGSFNSSESNMFIRAPLHYPTDEAYIESIGLANRIDDIKASTQVSMSRE